MTVTVPPEVVAEVTLSEVIVGAETAFALELKEPIRNEIIKEKEIWVMIGLDLTLVFTPRFYTFLAVLSAIYISFLLLVD